MTEYQWVASTTDIYFLLVLEPRTQEASLPDLKRVSFLLCPCKAEK
jgi:hypothetical protein